MTTPEPWLSVITVVKDDPMGFSATRTSVASQEAEGVEWIVVDGSEHSIDPERLPTSVDSSYIWSSPAGIYPAMNTGLRAARGRYVYFLNAGDVFHDTTTLSVLADLVKGQPLWLIGQVRFIDNATGLIVDPPPFDYERERRRFFAAGRFPPHQGTVMRRQELVSLGGFDTTYGIAADYDAALAFSRFGAPLVTEVVLADFTTGGQSSVQWRRALEEFHRARRRRLELRGMQRVQEWTLTARHNSITALARLRGRLLGSHQGRT